ncbi:hypothetical protein Q9233_010594, partial [Columba guinea]
TKTGTCLLQDGNQEPFKVRLHLAKDILTIQEQDVICVSGEPFYSGERTVTIRRQTVGGFGLSIKGGAEHNIPVVISKISKEQRAELSGLLFIGDAILQVPPVTKAVVHPLPYVTVVCISTTIPTTRQNAFQVIAVDGVCSGIIQCLSAEDCIDWLQAIASNISNLTKHNIKKINRNFPVNQQIVYMGWTEEREQDSLQDRMYAPKFLALRGSSLYKFIAPPCKTYACVLESHLMGLTIDFSMGFVCFDAATKAVLWRYKFSQLKGSSDDGKSKIKFLFQNQDTKQIEAKELEFSNLFAVLHCIHSFFAAKVACLDPLYVGSQATASAAPTTSGTGKLKYVT